jgi:hypothetical protein
MVMVEDFTGAQGLSVVNWGKMNRAVFVSFLAVGFCFPVAAAPTTTPSGQSQSVSFDQLNSYRAEMLSATNCSELLQSLPMLAFLDQQFSSNLSDMAEVMPAPDVVYPMMYVSAVPRGQAKTSQVDPKDSASRVQPLEKQPLEYHGEVGVLYGHSSGKFGGDLKEGYMLGTVGDDKVQITVGTSYQDWSGRSPRWTR